MARFLIASLAFTGHVLPALPIARKLVERGHDVCWYTGKKFRQKIEATGARFEPYRTAYDFDDRDINAAFPGRDLLIGLNLVKFDQINLFAKQTAPQYHDLQAILQAFPADVLVSDGAVHAVACIAEKGGPPYAQYCPTCLGIKSRDTAPFGMGLPPNRSPLGRVRNRFLQTLASNVLFREVGEEYSRQRASIGLGPMQLEGIRVSPYLFLEATVPGFEYPLSDLPPQVHFVGALLADESANTGLPAWWGEVMAKQCPVVLVTQGTLATDPRELIAPTLAGLGQEDLLVIVAGAPSSEALGMSSIPENARVESFIPFNLAMPFVDVFVTNGGFGGVHYALAHGVPIVIGGATEDKPEVANRAARAGAAINLMTHRPTAEQVREAVKLVLRTPGYREHARQLQAELAHHDAPTESAALLEQLAATKQPVMARVHGGQAVAAGAR